MTSTNFSWRPCFSITTTVSSNSCLYLRHEPFNPIIWCPRLAAGTTTSLLITRLETNSRILPSVKETRGHSTLAGKITLLVSSRVYSCCCCYWPNLVLRFDPPNPIMVRWCVESPHDENGCDIMSHSYIMRSCQPQAIILKQHYRFPPSTTSCCFSAILRRWSATRKHGSSRG